MLSSDLAMTLISRCDPRQFAFPRRGVVLTDRTSPEDANHTSAPSILAARPTALHPVILSIIDCQGKKRAGFELILALALDANIGMLGPMQRYDISDIEFCANAAAPRLLIFRLMSVSLLLSVWDRPRDRRHMGCIYWRRG